MRNQALTGYLLHQRAYQDNRAIYYLFTQEFGVVHGIGKKGAPLFEQIQLFASGKRELKSFSQLQMVAASVPIKGQQQYAGLYLNEILYRLLPVEDAFPELWQYYHLSLSMLRRPIDAEGLKVILREFERCLFASLGYEILMTQDDQGQPIAAEQIYRYQPDIGFIKVTETDDDIKTHNSTALNDSEADTSEAEHAIGSSEDDQNDEQSRAVISRGANFSSDFRGAQIVAMRELGFTPDLMPAWSKLHRQLIDHLLGYQPLQSRLLWQQQQRYQ